MTNIRALLRRRRPTWVVYGTALLCSAVSPSLAEELSHPGLPAPNSAAAPITVVTEAGTFLMSQREYAAFTRSMAPLPVMSPTYVFGTKIPRPQTDQFGHIRVVDGTATGAIDALQERPQVPAHTAPKPKQPAHSASTAKR